jgi:hypothetical protein
VEVGFNPFEIRQGNKSEDKDKRLEAKEDIGVFGTICF